MDVRELTIGEVARRSGIAASSIRYYESIGVLPEPGRTSGQRRYGEEVLGTIAFVQVAQQAGFTLREIRELMTGLESDASMAAPMRTLAARKLGEVEALLERARAMRGWLATASECTCASPAECTLFPEGDEAGDAAVSLAVLHVDGNGCRRVAG